MRTPTQTCRPLTADVILEDDTIRLEVEMPGLEHAVLDVDASGHTITVSGHRPFSDTGHYLLMERGRTFRRSFNLPHETDMKNLHARVRDGVLTISAPFGTARAAPPRDTRRGSAEHLRVPPRRSRVLNQRPAEP